LSQFHFSVALIQFTLYHLNQRDSDKLLFLQQLSVALDKNVVLHNKSTLKSFLWQVNTLNITVNRFVSLSRAASSSVRTTSGNNFQGIATLFPLCLYITIGDEMQHGKAAAIFVAHSNALQFLFVGQMNYSGFVLFTVRRRRQRGGGSRFRSVHRRTRQRPEVRYRRVLRTRLDAAAAASSAAAAVLHQKRPR
jgi:predicted nucleic acid-binding protein